MICNGHANHPVLINIYTMEWTVVANTTRSQKVPRMCSPWGTKIHNRCLKGRQQRKLGWYQGYLRRAISGKLQQTRSLGCGTKQRAAYTPAQTNGWNWNMILVAYNSRTFSMKNALNDFVNFLYSYLTHYV